MKTISFIIPVYNEEKRLEKTFEALRRIASQDELSCGLKLEEVIFVNDGSSDLTVEKIKQFAKEKNTHKPYQIRLIDYKNNQGKGYAVRQGMLLASADYTLLFDADISTPLTELSKFVQFIDQGADVIIGTRKNGHSTVIKHQPWLREHLGQGFTKLTNIALNTWVTDFTCGFKVFSKKAKDDIFEKSIINRWGYDAEVLFLAKNLRYTIVEQSVLWENDERTKVRLRQAIPQTLKELFQIRWHHTIKPLFSTLPVGKLRKILTSSPEQLSISHILL